MDGISLEEIMRAFPDEYYQEDGIYEPRLHGKPWYEWYRLYGCDSMAEIVAKAKELEEAEAWDEERMDIIGQNGAVGYTEDDILQCPDARKGIDKDDSM